MDQGRPQDAHLQSLWLCLACAATVLIITGTTDLTWAKPLSTTLEVEHIFVVLFVLGLVVQYFFAVTLMTFAAALAMIISNLLYTEITGVYLFASTNLPAAAFLGLLLLMTDPSTSPRTNVGRTLFGLGYGFGYVVVFELLGRLGAPELYAKLYPVPILNCTIQILDRFAKRGAIGRLNERWENGISKQKSNAIHIGLWAIVFGVMLMTSYVPYAEPGKHPGDSIAFWKRALAEHRYDAERKLIMVAGSQAVARNSAEAYNELGIIGLCSTVDSVGVDKRRRNAALRFTLAADLGHEAAAKNVLMMFLVHGTRRSDNDVVAALKVCERLAQQNDALACYLLGLAYETEGGVAKNLPEAVALYQRCPPITCSLRRASCASASNAPTCNSLHRHRCCKRLRPMAMERVATTSPTCTSLARASRRMRSGAGDDEACGGPRLCAGGRGR